jgi:hypothetical protein
VTRWCDVTRFDGVVIGSGIDARTYRTFDPPWWNLKRWFGWWFEGMREAVVRFVCRVRRLPVKATARGEVEVTLSGVRRRIRVIEIVQPLPNVPGPNVVDIKSRQNSRGFYR